MESEDEKRTLSPEEEYYAEKFDYSAHYGFAYTGD